MFYLSLKSSPFDKIFLVEKFEGKEELSHLFEFLLFVSTNKSDLKTKGFLGKSLTISLSLKEDERFFSGIIAKIEERETVSDVHGNYRIHYVITVVPELWRLQLSKDSKIFQEKSHSSIISEVLEASFVTDFQISLSSQGCWDEPRDVCIQYNETPFNFVSRLMEEDGIFYYFEHKEGAHTLTLSDSLHSPWADCGSIVHTRQHEDPWLNVMTHVYFQEQLVSSGFKSVDYNYMTPAVKLLPKVAKDGKAKGEENVYEFPGKFETFGEGRTHVEHRLQELEWESNILRGKSTVPCLSPGVTFTLENHPRSALNQKYYIYSVNHEYIHQSQDDPTSQVYQNTFMAFPEKTKFRPKRTTPKPRIHSHQTAIVTGPKGSEIFCDELGRIKIWFYWDIAGKTNEESSCWVRVAQNWAGAGFGGVVIPRIGMEVVVCFTEGDPDRPLVMGCVYHAQNKPPPYPGDTPEISTFKTRSSPGGKGYNELRFNDKAKEEEIFMHAQKDVNVIIEDSRTELFVKGDDTKTIKKGNMTELQEGSGTTHLLKIKNGDQIFKIKKGDRSTTLDLGDRNLTIKKGDDSNTITAGDNTYKIKKGSQNTTLSDGDKNITMKKGDFTTTIKTGNKSLTIEAGNYNIKLKSGNMSVKVTGDISFEATGNISFKANQNINLKAGIDVSIKADMNIQTKAGQMIQNKAGQMMMNESGQLMSSKSEIIMAEAKTLLQNKSGLAMINKADMSIKNQSGMIYEIKSDMMLKMEGGMMLEAKGGMMSKIEGGLMSEHKGGVISEHKGVMAIVKGALALIN